MRTGWIRFPCINEIETALDFLREVESVYGAFESVDASWPIGV